MTNSPEPQYAVVLTSCQRFDLLRQTVESFLRFADVRPRQFIIVEDSGDDTVRDVLTEFDYPFEIVIRQPESVKCNNFGYSLAEFVHKRQMVAIDAGYALVKTPLVFHCEDDWLFLRSGFIRESHILLQRFPEIARVGLRSVCSVEPATCEEHEGVRFFRLNSKTEPEAFVYSFNPGLRRMSDYRAVAPLSALGGESLVNEVFKELGFEAACCENPSIEHLGMKRSRMGVPPSLIVSLNTSWVSKTLSRVTGKISRKRKGRRMHTVIKKK